MKFIDLFAGLGGFHKALNDLGHECVFASEIDKELQNLYFENWGIEPYGDIIKIVEENISKIPEHDILCAGFPCQPFSQAGKRMGVNDKRGSLFNEIIKILKYRKPKFLILENVPHISNHDNKKTINKIIYELNLLGYDVDMEKYSPTDFGIPQNRKRLFIVGCLNGLDHFSFDTVNYEKSQQIDLNKFVSNKYKIDSKLSIDKINTLKVWQKFLDIIPKSYKMPSFPIWSMEFGANYPIDFPPIKLSKKDLGKYKGSFGIPLNSFTKNQQVDSLPNYAIGNDYFPEWKKRYILNNRNFYKSNKDKIDPILHLLKSLKFKTFQKLEWNVGGNERKIRNYFIQFRPSGIRIKKSNFFPSLVCVYSQLPIIGWQNRYINEEEALKLQCLEGIKLPKFKSSAFRSIGNAVNSRIVYIIMKHLLNLNSQIKIIKPKLKTAI